MNGRTLVRYVQVLLQLARVGVVRKSQLQAEFWFQVVMDCLWYASHIAVFEVLYSHAPDIAGWDLAAFRVLLGFLFDSDAFMMIWLGQMWRFGRDLKDGKLDPYRVRPGATFFLYAFQQFSVEGCVNMGVAVAYLAYAIGVAVPALTASVVALTGVAVLLSFWARIVIVALFSLLELYLLGSDAGRFLHDLFHATTDRPIDIFGARTRLFLLYIVPMGALTQIPASLVLQRYGVLEALGAVAWLFALGAGVLVAWHRGFRRYESAMS
jgi:ABC-type uncharacterized transport system permease subunit